MSFIVQKFATTPQNHLQKLEASETNGSDLAADPPAHVIDRRLSSLLVVSLASTAKAGAFLFAIDAKVMMLCGYLRHPQEVHRWADPSVRCVLFQMASDL